MIEAHLDPCQPVNATITVVCVTEEVSGKKHKSGCTYQEQLLPTIRKVTWTKTITYEGENEK